MSRITFITIRCELNSTLLPPHVVPAGTGVTEAGFFIPDVGDAGISETENMGKAHHGSDEIHSFRSTHMLDKKINKNRVRDNHHPRICW